MILCSTVRGDDRKIFLRECQLMLPSSQTGKYVVCAEDLPRTNNLPCAQEPIKRENLKNLHFKLAGTFQKVPIHMRRPSRVVFLRVQI